MIAIIAIIAGFAIKPVSNIFRLSLNQVVRELATKTKEAYNATLITGQVHRMVYDIDNKQFWVEAGPNTVLLDTPETLEREEQLNKFRSEEKKPVSKFSLDEKVTKKKISLPDGVSFKGIITEQSEEPIDAGIVYTHFFPHGVSEQTIIYVVDEGENAATLVITPINGKTRFFAELVDKDEIFKN